VLVAPPGAGKTTRVPPALAAAGIGGSGRLVVLEPRRIAARAAARRIADERGWRVGEEVGYQVRFERRAGPATRILVATGGIFLQRLQADPLLSGVGAVVFDEVHERSLTADLALAMVRQVQREVRPDLKLLAMSATLDAGPLAAFLAGCPILESHGRLFPVEIRYRERPVERERSRDRSRRGPGGLGGLGGLAEAVRDAVGEALDATAGDVLVFLPGVGEIERAGAALGALAERRGLAVVPLYGDLPAERQDVALRPLARRRVVLATNVAETSVTVEGVTVVVDGGLARRLRYDPATGLDRLEVARISRAAAEQRAGRAGRQAPGLCIRLWPEREHAALPARETPEIARVDLASPALQLLAWGERDLAAFGWLEPPEPAALARALALLAELGAIGGARGLTADGRAMARLPVHPRLARLLVYGRARGVTSEAALVAALLAERDPFRRPAPRAGEARRAARTARSDLLERADALEEFARRRIAGGVIGGPVGERLDLGAARFVLAAREQLVREVRQDASDDDAHSSGERDDAQGFGERDDALLSAIFAAFPDRLARRREPGSPRAVMVGGRGVRLAAESALADAAVELFVAVDVEAPPSGGGPARQGAEALVRLASAVELEWLPPERLATAVEVEWDAERERVVAWKRTRYRDLVLAASEVPAASDDAERLLAEAAAGRLESALPLADPGISSLLARVRSLRRWMPELGLPAFDDGELRGLLPALAAGRRSFAELRQAPLAAILLGALTREQRQALAREAPELLRVPSGREVRLVYEPGRPPLLAARIQEVFGWTAAPRLAAGRTPILLPLLAPNGRPQQVTDDLASFWRHGYPQVRKELRGRYPKHAWPEDPTTAPPERRPARRG